MNAVRAVEWWGTPERRIIIGASAWGPYPDEIAAAAESWELVQRVRPEWNYAQQTAALAIGWAESRWGVTPDFQMADGSPSWNWGAMVMKGTAGTIKHPDHLPDGKPTSFDFAAWDTADQGMNAWASMMEQARLAPALEAMRLGNATGIAEGMYAACLFSGTCPPDCSDDARIRRYGKVIVGAANHVAALLGNTSPIKEGERVGLPMGKCSWHEKNGGGTVVPPPASGGGSEGAGSAGWIIGGAAVLGVLAMVMR